MPELYGMEYFYQDYCEHCNQPISNEKLIEISNKKDFEKFKKTKIINQKKLTKA